MSRTQGGGQPCRASVVDSATISAVLVGGVITLLGTLVANYLQHRAEKRERRRQRLEQRLEEVRRYVMNVLRFADLVCDGARIENQPDLHFSHWVQSVRECVDQWGYRPVSGSPLVLFVADEELRALVEEFGSTGEELLGAFAELMSTGTFMEEAITVRERLKHLAERATKRADELVDRG